jgi:hypothetical protein
MISYDAGFGGVRVTTNKHPNLDGEADDAPHHFYTMRNILGQNPVPTLTDRGIVEDFWQQ